MSKVISQAQATQAAAAKVNGSADSILKAAVGLFTAGNGLAAQVRALFASPAPVVEATLTAVFEQLEGRLPKMKDADKPAAWASIANSVATNVRIQWNKLEESARPGVCYIALDRGALTAKVIVLQSPTKKEVGQALALDPKAKNAAIARLFPSKPAAASKPADEPTVSIGQPDKHAPRADAIGVIMEQLVPFSSADLHELSKRIAAEIDRRTAAALEKAEAKGRGPSAAGKPNSKSRGESQAKAKEKAQNLAA